MSKTVHSIGTYNQGKYCAMQNGKITKMYAKWSSMLKRCYCENTLKKQPTYKDCTVAEEFLEFQVFAEWAEKQVGWATENYELDKDILVKDNKVYCRDTVVFVPESLNTFFTNRMTSRGRYPQGIHERKDRGVLASYVGYRGGREFVGHFTNVADAMVAFARAKTAAGRRWGDALRSGEFIVDERVIVAMENYKFEYNEE